ncbi:hypothetical protein MTO96_030491 [Rhipicephalus appendiculatus]
MGTFPPLQQFVVPSRSRLGMDKRTRHRVASAMTPPDSFRRPTRAVERRKQRQRWAVSVKTCVTVLDRIPQGKTGSPRQQPSVSYCEETLKEYARNVHMEFRAMC